MGILWMVDKFPRNIQLFDGLRFPLGMYGIFRGSSEGCLLYGQNFLGNYGSCRLGILAQWHSQPALKNPSESGSED